MFEMSHLKCFPESKEIEVYDLMVKRKSCFYHLPDSVPIKLAFRGVRGTWFLHVKARRNRTQYSKLNPVTEDIHCESDNIDITDPLEPEDYGDKRENGGSDHRQASRSVTEVPSSKVFSEAKSVTSIINRYFMNSDEKSGFTSPTNSEATSKCKKTEKGSGHCRSSKVKVPRSKVFRLVLTSGRRVETSVKGKRVNSVDVGERLVAARNNLGVFSSKKKHLIVCDKASLNKRPNDWNGLVISKALDKFYRSIIEEHLADLYKEINSSSRDFKSRNSALLLLASITMRGSVLASDLAKIFDFKLKGFANLSAFKKKRDLNNVNSKMTRATRSTMKAFVGLAMSFLEIGKPGLLRWVLQQKEI